MNFILQIPFSRNVTSREGRVSRNQISFVFWVFRGVTSREGRVSRNYMHLTGIHKGFVSRPARGV